MIAARTVLFLRVLDECSNEFGLGLNDDQKQTLELAFEEFEAGWAEIRGDRQNFISYKFLLKKLLLAMSGLTSTQRFFAESTTLSTVNETRMEQLWSCAQAAQA